MISAIIIMPEITKGMKSIGPKGLLSINKKTSIIEYQIKMLRSINKNIDICVIVGFEHEKVVPVLEKNRVRFIFNDQYKNTNQGYSLKLYLLNNHCSNNLLIINNGILFNQLDVFKKSLLDNSSQIFSINSNKSDFDLGTLSGQNPEYIFYDLPESWSECIYFHYKDLVGLKKICQENHVDNMYLFEIVNQYISHYPNTIKKTYLNKKSVLKINSIKDIKRAKRFVV